MSERASEMVSLVATIDPDLSTGKTWNSDVIDASLYDSILFIVMTGSISSSSGKVLFKCLEGTASGTVSTTVGSTSRTQASTGTQDYQILYDLDCEDLTGPNYRYVKGQITVSGSTGAYIAMAALGFKPRFHPASDGDLASVYAIKTST